MPSASPLARAGLALLALAGSVSANNKLTSTPADFRGFFLLDNGAVSTVTCSSGATFYTSSTYGACCVSDNCNFATACSGGTATRIFGGTYTCDATFPDCYTMTVFASYPSADQSWLVKGCATNWRAFTIYREIITATSASATTKTASQANSATLTGAKETPTGANNEEDGGSGQITAPPTGLPKATGTPQPVEEDGSKAWIAGAVIGPIIGLALIGLVAFWLLRRRAANENHTVGQAASDAKAAPFMADQSSMHTSVYYGAGSPGMAPAVSPGPKYYPGEPPSTVTSTPSPVNGYANAPYQQQAAYGAVPYPPQQGQYPPQQGQYPPQPGQYAPQQGQYSPQPSQYSPQPYPAQFAPAMDRYPGPQNTAELASGPIVNPPQELGDGMPMRK